MDLQSLKIDRTLLTGDQIKELDRWEQFFAGPIWRDIVLRFDPEISGLQNSYGNVVGEQMLGRIQGSLLIFDRILGKLPQMVYADFLVKTGQLEGRTEDPSTEDPDGPTDWRR